MNGRPAEAGSAVVEFLGAALLLLVPIVYLVLVLGRLQGAAFAVDGAAREAVRAVALTAATEWDQGAAAQAAARIALADQGIAATDPVELACDPDCASPGALVTARVEVAVDLPLVPALVRDAVPLVVPVSASATGTVDAFVGAP